MVPVVPIVDVLQYNQRDPDTAVEGCKSEATGEEQVWELYAKNLEMGRILDEFEGILYQVQEEAQK